MVPLTFMAPMHPFQRNRALFRSSCMTPTLDHPYHGCHPASRFTLTMTDSTPRPIHRRIPLARLALSMTLTLSLSSTPSTLASTLQSFDGVSRRQASEAGLISSVSTTPERQRTHSSIISVTHVSHNSSEISDSTIAENLNTTSSSNSTLEAADSTGKGKATEPHKSNGERIATYLRSAGVPDALVVFIISALPVVELRAGIPVGFLLGLHPLHTFFLAIIGNLAPILPTLLLLRLSFVQSLCQWVLTRARRKADTLGTVSSRAAALALFVGVPLPGTGAWTGAMVAFVLGMSTPTAFASLAVGVVMAAVIMTALCQLGWIGAVVAGVALGSTGTVALVTAVRQGRAQTDSA